jgi:uncharacterized MAPEG superfamily protein
VTIIIQAFVATIAHRKQAVMIPGIVDSSLSHDSFVFRSDRTFRNSLENIIPMLGMSILAMLVGASTIWVAACIWVYAIARIIHMALYYKIATEKNPSPRSYFYMIALLANLVLVGVVAVGML